MNSTKELKAKRKKLAAALASKLIDSLENRPEEWRVLSERTLTNISTKNDLRVSGLFVWYGVEVLFSLKLHKAIHEWRRRNAVRMEIENLKGYKEGLK
tara:strand:+ start:2965 stop:3258 length:294 start_codon:yes stop_codon:yes gene_type:complete